jgi:hypothetical protein
LFADRSDLGAAGPAAISPGTANEKEEHHAEPHENRDVCLHFMAEHRNARTVETPLPKQRFRHFTHELSVQNRIGPRQLGKKYTMFRPD